MTEMAMPLRGSRGHVVMPARLVTWASPQWLRNAAGPRAGRVTVEA
jgi:hypothetical protein